MKTDILNILKEGTHVQMLINRATGNTCKSSKRWISKTISNSVEEYDKNVEFMISQQEYIGNEGVRLYASLNPRNMNKAITMFTHKQIDAGYNSEFYKDIWNKFISCLMKPENKVKEYYMIDIDTKDKNVIQKIENKLLSILHSMNLSPYVMRGLGYWSYETPNGRHYIAPVFDSHEMSTYINKSFIDIDNSNKVIAEVKTDGLILLNTLDTR